MADHNNYMQWIGAAFIAFCAAVLLANLMTNVKTRTYQDNVNACELRYDWFDSLVGTTMAVCGQKSKTPVNATDYGFPFREKTIYTDSAGRVVGVDCSGGVWRNSRIVNKRVLKKDAACPSRAVGAGGLPGVGALLANLVLWPSFWFYFVLSGCLYFIFITIEHKRKH